MCGCGWTAMPGDTLPVLRYGSVLVPAAGAGARLPAAGWHVPVRLEAHSPARTHAHTHAAGHGDWCGSGQARRGLSAGYPRPDARSLIIALLRGCVHARACSLAPAQRAHARTPMPAARARRQRGRAHTVLAAALLAVLGPHCVHAQRALRIPHPHVTCCAPPASSSPPPCLPASLPSCTSARACALLVLMRQRLYFFGKPQKPGATKRSRPKLEIGATIYCRVNTANRWIYVCICMCECVYTYSDMCICVYVCMCICVYICDININTANRCDLFIYTYIHIYI